MKMTHVCMVKSLVVTHFFRTKVWQCKTLSEGTGWLYVCNRMSRTGNLEEVCDATRIELREQCLGRTIFALG